MRGQRRCPLRFQLAIQIGINERASAKEPYSWGGGERM
jgi:hypothetical protein